MVERTPDKGKIQVQFLVFLPNGRIVQKQRCHTVTVETGEHYPLRPPLGLFLYWLNVYGLIVGNSCAYLLRRY